jgi:hypothetical protein
LNAHDAPAATAAAAAAVSAGEEQDGGSSSGGGSVGGGRRRLRTAPQRISLGSRRQLLVRTEYEREGNYCQHYVAQTTFSQPLYECEIGNARRVGVFVSAWVRNTASYLRQVRLQASVDPDSDPSMYVGTMFLSQTQPWKSKDPWLQP